MSRTVRDSAMLLQVLAGHDHRDRGSLRDAPDDYLAAADRGVSGLRIAWSPDFGYAPVDDEVARTTATAAKAFEEMGATVEETDLDVGEPFDAFWDLFSTISLARAGTFPEEHHDELTWYGKETYERGAGVSGPAICTGTGRNRGSKSQVRGPIRPIRPTLVADPGDHRLSGRDAAQDYRWQAYALVLGLPPIYIPDQHDRQPRRERTMRLLIGRTAHRPSHRRKAGRRALGHCSLSSLRRGVSVGPPQAADLIGVDEAFVRRYFTRTSWSRGRRL